MAENGKNPEKTGESAAEKATEAEQKKERIAGRRVKDFQMFILHALVLMIILCILFLGVVGFATVPNDDMYPRLDAGDLLLFYRLDKDVKAQDIIVFEKNNTRYVGRVVAVGGDTVEITDSESLIINGNTVMESNIFYPTPRYEGYVEYPLTLPQGTCFVLTDKRRGGEDSRYFGPVQSSEIEGIVITVLRRNNL